MKNLRQTNGPETALSARFHQAWLLGILLVVFGVFIYMVRSFLTPVVLAAVFAGLAWPLYVRIVDLVRGRRGLAAIVTLLLLILGVLIPVYVTLNLVVIEAAALYESTRPHLEAALAAGDRAIREIAARVGVPRVGDSSSPLLDWLGSLPFQTEDLAPSLQGIAGTTGTLAASLINWTSRGTLSLVINFFIIVFTMYYFFRDGERIVERIRYLSPLDPRYEDVLVERLISISRATLRGSLILGIVQGGIGAVTLWIAGAQAPVLWGVVMVVLSIIPLVGTWIVMYPIAIVQFLLGHPISALFIALMTGLIISSVDNVLRPRLIGRGARIHDLVIFFSTLGGIALFGVMGFIVGPIIAAFFLAMVDIYALEFKSQLDADALRVKAAEEREDEGTAHERVEDGTRAPGDAVGSPGDDPEPREAGLDRLEPFDHLG